MANETLAHLKVGQIPKDDDWSLADGRSVRFAHALNDGVRRTTRCSTARAMCSLC